MKASNTKSVTINKSLNKGNTFTGLVCAAFNCDAASVQIDPSMQFAKLGMGSVEVDGVYFDWFKKGDNYTFTKAV